MKGDYILTARHVIKQLHYSLGKNTEVICNAVDPPFVPESDLHCLVYLPAASEIDLKTLMVGTVYYEKLDQYNDWGVLSSEYYNKETNFDI